MSIIYILGEWDLMGADEMRDTKASRMIDVGSGAPVKGNELYTRNQPFQNKQKYSVLLT